ncbi:MAG: FAD-dependent monooxygenase, partial [Clostridia bacterium]|nr:FAD-dependent monooxygenase [Clostridia bacterium]
MDHFTDAVIIGGGPAGSSCGIYLQRAGISNMIIEKRSFPKDKLCAGLVTEKTYRQLSKLIKTAVGTDVPDEIFCDKSKRIKLFYKDEPLTDSAVSSLFRLVFRRDLDGYLIETYKKTGGILYENRTVKEYDLDNNTLSLDNGDTVKYKYLIGADGALSPTRKALGYKSPDYIFCTEAFVPKTAAFDDNCVRIYFGYLNKGYVWVFPHGDTLCVGLGDEYRKKTEYEKVLRAFLLSNGLDDGSCKIKGA